MHVAQTKVSVNYKLKWSMISIFSLPPGPWLVTIYYITVTYCLGLVKDKRASIRDYIRGLKFKLVVVWVETMERTISTDYGIIIYLGFTDVIHAIRQHFVRFVTRFFSIVNTFYSRDKLMKDRRKLESAEHDHVSYYTFYIFTLHN